MTDEKKKKPTKTNPPKAVTGFDKQPGQVGLHAPNSLDALRRQKPDQRQQQAPEFSGGISEPVVSPQTYDLYNTPKKKKKK